MFIDKNSIVVNGVNFGQYLVQVQYFYSKLWANDSGRNLAGVMSGTLIGVFPKLVMSFRSLTKSELEIIVPILDSQNQSVTYYDPNKKTNVTMTTYTGDYEIVNKHIVNGERKNEPFNCSFISTRRRV